MPVDDDLGGGRQCPRSRYAEIGDETDGRGVMLVDLAVGSFRAFQRGRQNEIQNPSLLVAKQRSKRVIRLAEVSIEEAYDLREIAALERLATLG